MCFLKYISTLILAIYFNFNLAQCFKLKLLSLFYFKCIIIENLKYTQENHIIQSQIHITQLQKLSTRG